MKREKKRSCSDKDNDDHTALMIAARFYGHLETISLLIENGADVNAKRNDGVTALMIASLHGDIDIIKFLIENGADVNTKSNHGYTALMGANLQGDIDIIEFLIDKGAVVNAKDIDPVQLENTFSPHLVKFRVAMQKLFKK